MKPRWTGPQDGDVDAFDEAIDPPLPPERWPYGPPEFHQSCCRLFGDGKLCDCAASSSNEEDLDWGNKV